MMWWSIDLKHSKVSIQRCEPLGKRIWFILTYSLHIIDSFDLNPHLNIGVPFVGTFPFDLPNTHTPKISARNIKQTTLRHNKRFFGMRISTRFICDKNMIDFSMRWNGGNYRITMHDFKLNFQFSTNVQPVRQGTIVGSPCSFAPFTKLTESEFKNSYLVG